MTKGDFSRIKFAATDDPPAANVAIAIACRPQQHAGIFFPFLGKASLLHFDGIVHCEPATRLMDFAWMAIALDPHELSLVTLWAESVAMGRPAINYRIAYSDGSRYDIAKAEFLPGTGCEGLTCATFVMWVFRQAGIRPLDTENWKSTPSDQAWVRQQVERVRAVRARTCAAFERDIKAHRFRPSDIGAAALFDLDTWPIGFDVARRTGMVLVEFIDHGYGQ